MEELIGLAAQVGVFVTLILIGLFAGTATEKRHLRQLATREAAMSSMLVTELRSFPGGADPSAGAMVVTAQAVIATDYLKTFIASLINIFGGEVTSFQTLLTRARREALLRALEQARDMGYDAVCNVRLDTADMGGATTRRGAVMVGILATGTAYRRASAAPRRLQRDGPGAGAL